jgi:bifunctional DNA-binding transcriptional regulator/antitoxin component of YhaV-PrlF toxin-antitoxin module
MTSIARVQARGQVTVPQEIRESCEVVPGCDLVFTQLGKMRFQCLVLPHRSLTEMLEAHTLPGPAPDLAQLREDFGEELAQRSLPTNWEERQ